MQFFHCQAAGDTDIPRLQAIHCAALYTLELDGYGGSLLAHFQLSNNLCLFLESHFLATSSLCRCIGLLNSWCRTICPWLSCSSHLFSLSGSIWIVPLLSSVSVGFSSSPKHFAGPFWKWLLSCVQVFSGDIGHYCPILILERHHWYINAHFMFFGTTSSGIFFFFK